jgi:hypothetical protein
MQMTPSPEVSNRAAISSSTPNGKVQRPTFLLSVNGPSEDSPDEPSTPPGKIYYIKLNS